MATQLSAQQIETLLGKLSTDDNFRAAFEKDAASALTSIGLPTEMAACCKGKKLASKEQLSGSRDALSKFFSRSMGQNVHDLVQR